jgi:hypothetical protein
MSVRSSDEPFPSSGEAMTAARRNAPWEAEATVSGGQGAVNKATRIEDTHGSAGVGTDRRKGSVRGHGRGGSEIN